MLIAYSSERRESMRMQIGSANYSYIFVENALVSMLKEAGYRTSYVTEPEIFKTELSYLRLLGAPASDIVHLCFRSTENIRVMRGAYNICHFAWEFDVLKKGGLATESLLRNQVHMLSLMDEVWVGCHYTLDILSRHGLTKAFLIPAPIVKGAPAAERIAWPVALELLASIPVMPLVYAGASSREDNAALSAECMMALSQHHFIHRRSRNGHGRLYLSVLSPGDLRKNLLNIIDGFILAAQDDDLLVIKMAVANKAGFREFGLYDSLTPLCDGQMSRRDQRVVFIMDYLSETEMSCLFSIADFYLCASHAEGYNLPLLQAMSFGAVPITTRNTAMLDYIDDANALIINERVLISPIENMAADVAAQLYAVGFASRFDIARAIVASANLSSRDRVAKSERAQQAVWEHYGVLASGTQAKARFEAITAARLSA